MDFSNCLNGTVLYFKVRSGDLYTPFEMEFTATLNDENRYLAKLGLFGFIVIKNPPVERHCYVLAMMIAGPAVPADKILSVTTIPHNAADFKKLPRQRTVEETERDIADLVQAFENYKATR